MAFIIDTFVCRFGETKMKFASYSLAEMRARKGDQDLLSDSVETGSVHTNISLQVPIFEERLNGTYVLQRKRDALKLLVFIVH
jgi:hypothetical protein